MRTTIRLNEELARRAKDFAHDSGRSFTDLVAEALSSYIARPKAPLPRKPIVLPTSGNPHGKKITDKQYRAIIEKTDEDEAKRIMTDHSNDVAP